MLLGRNRKEKDKITQNMSQTKILALQSSREDILKEKIRFLGSGEHVKENTNHLN